MRTRFTQKAVLFSVVLGPVIGLLTVSGHAQTDAAKPSPEMKKLEGLVGDWRYEGKQSEPLAPGMPYGGAGKYFGTFTNRFVLNGFFLEGRIEDNNPGGKTTAVRMTGYDARAKNYVEYGFDSDGGCGTGTSTLDGRTCTLHSTMIAAGKKVLQKVVVKYSSDWSSYTLVGEASIDDGKTWPGWWKEEGRKVASPTAAEQELKKLEEDWTQALVKRDLSVLDRILAEEWTFTDPEGTPVSKAQYLAWLRSGECVVTSMVNDAVQVRIYGDMAVVNGLDTEKSQFKGKDISGQYRWTDTLIKRDGRWQSVATHGSKVAKGADSKALEGAWRLAEYDYGDDTEEEKVQAIKAYWSGTFYCTFYNAKTGKIESVHGGTYTYDGKTLAETIGFCSVEDLRPHLGTTVTFNVEVKDGKFYQSGEFGGAPLKEVWEHATLKP